jgi:hypothetical protein
MMLGSYVVACADSHALERSSRGRAAQQLWHSVAVGYPFAPVGIITASFGEAFCVKAFSSCV